MLFPLTVMSVATSMVVILFCCLVMARYKRLFDKLKIPISIITVLGGIILYTIGYLPENNTQAGQSVLTVALRAIYSTCRIFIMESDLSEVNQYLQSNSLYLFAMNIVQTMGVIITIMTILSTFGVKFISRLKLVFTRARQIYIFMGFNEASVNLIKSLRKNGKSKCFIIVESLQDNEDDGDLLLRLKEDSFILVDKVWQEISGLRDLKIPLRLLKREVHIFALSEQESMNIRVCLNLSKQSSNRRDKNDNIHFYVNTTDESTEKIFEMANKENGAYHEFKIFNTPDLSARQLFNTYPIHDYIQVDTDRAHVLSGFTIFIAGLGATGIEVLRKSIYLGQFTDSSYRAIITDIDMTQKRGNLFNKYPAIKKNYSIETYNAIPGDEDFFQLLEENIESINYIVVTLDDDGLNMKTAAEIQRLVNRSNNKDLIIAVHIKEKEQYEHFEQYGLLPNIRFFGRNSDIFTESIIINESMDRMAKKMNALYNEIYNVVPSDNWASLDSFTKESNRAAAMNFATKLRLLGLKLVEKKEGVNTSEAVNLLDYLKGERLDNLAKQEHLRWNAFHYASGWTTWPLSETGSSKRAKDLLNRRHACLVAWEELPKVTKHFNQSPTYQELDYEQVRNISKIIEYAGYEVTKI